MISLNPFKRKSAKRFEQYLEREGHEWVDASETYRGERDDKERQMDSDLVGQGRAGSNWLENREMCMTNIVLEYVRTLVVARMDLRRRLAPECPELLSDAELSKLENSLLSSIRSARSARRDDYELRARAAGVQMVRPKQRDAAEYGNLEALARRKVAELRLDRSLGRTIRPAKSLAILAKKIWHDPVFSKVIAQAILGIVGGVSIAALWTHHLGWWSRPSAKIQLPGTVGVSTRISIKYTRVPLDDRLWLATQGTARVWTYGTCDDPPGSLIERASSPQKPTRDHEGGTWISQGEINIGSKNDIGKTFTVFIILVSEAADRDLAYEFKNRSEACGKTTWDGRDKLPPGRILAHVDVTRR